MDRIERDGALHKDAIAEEVLAALAIEAPLFELSREQGVRLTPLLSTKYEYVGEVQFVAPSICGERPPEQTMPTHRIMHGFAPSGESPAGFGIVADPETVRDAVETMRREYGGHDAAPEMVRRAESADAVRQGKVVAR